MAVSDTGCSVVLGSLDIVHTGIAQGLDITSGHHNLQHLHKTVHLGSSQILCKVISSV